MFCVIVNINIKSMEYFNISFIPYNIAYELSMRQLIAILQKRVAIFMAFYIIIASNTFRKQYLQVMWCYAFNGDLTSRENGSVGGQTVKKMVEAYEKIYNKIKKASKININ